jgi:hypothetical protein
MNLPIWDRTIQAVERDVTGALAHIHHSHTPPAITTQGAPMAATLADAIHAAVTAAVSDILDRYMTAENLAAATLDEVRAQQVPAQPLAPLPPPPAAAVQPGDPDQGGDAA